MSKQQTELQKARAAVNAETFGTPAWEAAMQVVRRLVEIENAERPAEEYFSVDSRVHRTFLLTPIRGSRRRVVARVVG